MSRIEQLIDEIEEFIESCKPAPFSSTKIVVPKDQLLELTTELRLKTPDEIKRYQKIIAQKDKIIGDAKAQAEQMIAETEEYARALVENHEIMLKAYEKADQTINAANAEAKRIMDAANQNAEEVRVGSLQYATSLLSNIQNAVANSIEYTRANSDALISNLSETMQILTDNHNELAAQVNVVPGEQPAYDYSEQEEEYEEPAPEEEEEDEEIDEVIEDDEEVVSEEDAEDDEEEEEEEVPAPPVKSRKKDDDDIFEDDDEDFDDID